MAIIDDLCTTPADDAKYRGFMETATKGQLRLAVQIMQLNPSGNKERLDTCKAFMQEQENETPKVSKKASVALPKPTTKADTKSAKTKDTKPKEIKIVAFPSEKPKTKPLATSSEHHTFDECKAKLAEASKKYNDADNEFVIRGLLQKCADSQDFRNNLMLKEKTYDGFYKYMFDAVRAGYCIKVGDIGGMLSKEKALDLAYDYFNMLEVIKPEEKKKVAEKLTKEVNKIVKEVNKEVKEVNKEDGFIKEADGQLSFDF